MPTIWRGDGSRTMDRSLRFLHRSMRTGGVRSLGLFALGVATATALFSVVDATLLKGLPFPQDDELVVLQAVRIPEGRLTHFSAFDLADLERWAGPFDAVGSITESTITLPGNAFLESVPTATVSPSFFETLTIDSRLGRAFRGENRTDCTGGVILSHGYWAGRLSARADAVGWPLGTGTWRRDVIGVLPEGFIYPLSDSRPALWFCMNPPPAGQPRPNQVSAALTHLVGRLRPGVTVAEAQSQVDTYLDVLRATGGRAFQEVVVQVRPLRDAVLGDARTRVALLGGASALLFALCCLNVAGVLAVRISRMEAEFRMRLALGATRSHLIVHFVRLATVESAAAATLSLPIAAGAIALMNVNVPPSLPVYRPFELDARALGVAAIATLVASIVAVATAIARVPDASIGMRPSVRRRPITGALVGGQVMAAVLLLVSAGLFTLSFQHVAAVDRGFVPEGLLSIRAYARSGTPVSGTDYHGDLLARLAALPGVRAVALASACAVPLVVPQCPIDVVVPETGALFSDRDGVSDRPIHGPYFEVMGMQVIAGVGTRAGPQDGLAVLNASAATRFFETAAAAVGQQLLAGERSVSIIGVVSDVRAAGPEAPAQPAVYRFVSPGERGLDRLVIRIDENIQPVDDLIRQSIASALPGQAVPGMLSLEARFDGLIAERRFAAVLVATMGLLGLTAAASGLWTLIQAIVTRREAEIAVRRALGAGPRQVAAAILRTELGFALGGVCAGALAALLVGQLVDAHLVPMGPVQWLAYADVPLAGCVLILGGVATVMRGAFRQGFDVIRNQPASSL